MARRQRSWPEPVARVLSIAVVSSSLKAPPVSRSGRASFPTHGLPPGREAAGRAVQGLLRGVPARRRTLGVWGPRLKWSLLSFEL